MNTEFEFAEKIIRKFLLGGAILSIMQVLIFALTVGVMIFILIKMGNKDKKKPRIRVPATIVSKRSHMYHSHHGRVGHHGCYSHYRHYVTFQLESGDRMELSVSSNDVGLLVEGDRGMLTFQGEHFLSFDRNWSV